MLYQGVGGSRGAGGGIQRGSGTSAAPAPGARPPSRGALSRPRARRSARSADPSPGLFDRGSRPRSGGAGSSGSAVPFSEGWRAQAAPELSGPTGTPTRGSAPTGGTTLGAQPPSSGSSFSGSSFSRPSSTGPSIASRGHGGAGWSGEARKLSGRLQSLSRELGRLGQSSASSEPSAETASEREAFSAATTSSAQTNDPEPPGDEPPQVPLGGAEWLAAAGAAYAIRRLRQEKAEDTGENNADEA